MTITVFIIDSKTQIKFQIPLNLLSCSLFVEQLHCRNVEMELFQINKLLKWSLIDSET